MKRHLLLAPVLSFIIFASAPAQDFDSKNLQIHGFAAQAFLASDHNNYLGMNTSKGTGDWTEAALNVNDQVSNHLRVGIQLHYTRMGMFGSDVPTIDWALGDYTVNDMLGIRAGKVKIRWGLFNDTQDYDPGYLWSLLPESTYPIDWRSTSLADSGVELYGRFRLGKLGKLSYTGIWGYYTAGSNDAFNENITAAGFTVVSQPAGKSPAVDLRWETPLKGLTLGAATMYFDAYGTTTTGTITQPSTYWSNAFAAFERGRLYAAAQYTREPVENDYNITGGDSFGFKGDNRSWFVMGAYRVTDKLQLGAYYDHQTYPNWGNISDPANHNFDKVISARYELNENFYLKLEGHFIDGESAGLYAIDNPNGFQPTNNLAIAKLGFTF